MEFLYFNRDKSWLSFNERVLMEASGKHVPLMERLNFLSIYSSNLDEFYRVRMPALMALDKIQEDTGNAKPFIHELSAVIKTQQERFGKIMRDQILPGLKKHKVSLLYAQPVPGFLRTLLKNYFLNHIAAFVRVVNLKETKKFFPENNKLYLLAFAKSADREVVQFIINIPSDTISRFYSFLHRGITYIVFLDDIVKINLNHLLPDHEIISCHNLKVTRSGELDIDDEFEGDMADKIEKELKKRDMGLATRFLYEGEIGKPDIKNIKRKFGLKRAGVIKGGRYHNLKDLATIPLTRSDFFYKPWPVKEFSFGNNSIFNSIRGKCFLLHTPYHTFDPLLRFFNEASIDPDVTAIYTTIYRIAKNSLIAHALMNAARNGKKVQVFVELKARFDEENNLKWARKMEQAGVRIIFSIPVLKVHCKIALVKRKRSENTELFGILGTGNFHENNAALYTDHFLFTNESEILSEVEMLFRFLRDRKRDAGAVCPTFRRLLVGQFNLQDSFLRLIENEIDYARDGFPASVIIKVNNLEDTVLINKLCVASQAGVKISLLVRGICCLVPGIGGMSTNITVTRIIDRYLEHGRIFIFENNGNPLVYLGSCDWMKRNMYRRVEVCFPITDTGQKEELIHMINLQLADNTQAVNITLQNENQVKENNSPRKIRSQQEISLWLASDKRKPGTEKIEAAIPLYGGLKK